eukprot:TRINITY_DN10010_c0_g1_i1.p1 TRINITY_DN10010_c0_g1~~TRINITY_DN10010_c0_g1_i1.p1  ORF type:complete len:470 (+),score=90.50 TRINITY_DN10010_c0_g1_i1:123-1532(+)
MDFSFKRFFKKKTEHESIIVYDADQSDTDHYDTTSDRSTLNEEYYSSDVLLRDSPRTTAFLSHVSSERKLSRGPSFGPFKRTLLRFSSKEVQPSAKKGKNSKDAPMSTASLPLVEFENPSLISPNSTPLSPRFGSSKKEEGRRALGLLLKPDLTIVFAFCTSILYSEEASRAAHVIVQIFEENGLAFYLLKTVIHFEVERADEEGTLLRNTSVATLLMSAYVRLIGERYLSVLLKQLLLDFLSSKVSLEIDPNRLDSGEDIEKNIANLFEITKAFLNEICSSVDLCPMPLRILCGLLRNEVRRKFPEATMSAIGGFFFLRFVCPALVTPETFNFFGNVSISLSARRSLILVSKLLQSLTNGVPFGDKEAYMIPLNNFIFEHMPSVTQFFEALTAVEFDDPSFKTSDVIFRSSNLFLVECFQIHRSRIESEINIILENCPQEYDPFEIFSTFPVRKKKTPKINGKQSSIF